MSKRKAKQSTGADEMFENGVDLFVDEPADKGSDADDADTTDSEESVYSGLEEEEEDSEDEDSSDNELNGLDDDSGDEDEDDEEDDDDDDESSKESSDEELIISKKTNKSKGKKGTPTIGGLNDNVANESKEKKMKDKNQKLENELSNSLNAQSISANNKAKLMKSKAKKKQGDSVKEIRKEGTGEETNVAKVDEYDYDSSDEEDIRNTVGNIPMEWYQNMTHIGYDIEGRKLIKPKQGDKLDDFLSKADDANYWRTVTNKMTGQNVVLSKDDVELVQNLMTRRHPTMSEEELYAPWIDFFTHETMIHPLSNRPEHKRSFIPSKWEKLKVGQMVHALNKGWMKFSDPEKKEEEEEEDEIPKYFDIWKDENESEINRRFKQHIPAPKMTLPGHEESYNPPPEYLFTKEEQEKWENQEPSERRMNFIPQKFSSLRSVTAYPRFINERFERCLDLYLCPRQRKVRMNVDPEDLIPKLPKPKDLQPFPTSQAMIYIGHKDMVRSITVDPSGQWLASGSDDTTIKIWEVITGRCMKTIELGSKVKCIAWNPNPAVCLIACAIDQDIVLLNPGVGDKLQVNNTDNMLNSFEAEDTETSSTTTWSELEGEEYEKGLRLKVTHSTDVSQVTWHAKGDYFANVLPQGVSKSVCIHQLSRRRSQYPFSKSKGLVQCVRFHPLRPFLFVATQRYIRVYNLLKQEMSKKLMCNCKWISSMDVHPEGDNVIIGSYDTRLNWFDLDLSTKPYQTLKHHKKAVRSVCYHKKYPLFASASDDTSVIVSHGMVYNDLLQNPLIVPVKILRGHATVRDIGVLDCVFHPTQPWIFSSGADASIRLFT